MQICSHILHFKIEYFVKVFFGFLGIIYAKSCAKLIVVTNLKSFIFAHKFVLFVKRSLIVHDVHVVDGEVLHFAAFNCYKN